MKLTVWIDTCFVQTDSFNFSLVYLPIKAPTHRGGFRIFSQGGSGGTKGQRDAAGVWGDGKKGGLGVLPQENLESEVL